ncbi:putative transcription factor GRAS family [Dioscorea sansibarensis]
MEKFARLMGVPFEFQVVSGVHKVGGAQEGGFQSPGRRVVVAVNLIGALRRVNIDERSDFLRVIHQLKPKVVTVVEEEADFTSNKDVFVMCFEECLRFYGVFFEMLEESFGVTSDGGGGGGGGAGGNGSEYCCCERREKGDNGVRD